MIHASVTLLSDVEPQPVNWLWPSRIPLGMITIFDGDPGLGKSTVLLDLAARLSRGKPMPDGSPGPKIAGTVILTAEDDLARVVRPRLDAAGADASRIITTSVWDGNVNREAEITAGDLAAVEEAAQFVGARLIIVDPLMAYLPREVNSNRDQDVRRALVHLRDLAERTGAAIVVVRHLNKALGGPALYRGGGSIGIIGAARAGLVLAADPEAPHAGRVLAVVKSNLAPKPPSLRLQLVQKPDHAFAGVEWGEACDLSVDQLLDAAEKPERRGALVVAKAFLRDVLAQGAVSVKEVELEAAESGIAEVTLRRARRELGVLTEKVGRPSQPDQHWRWSLPERDPEGGEASASIGVTTRADDPLRKPPSRRHSADGTSPKAVTSHSDDLLPGHDAVAASDADSPVLPIDLAQSPLLDGPAIQALSVASHGAEMIPEVDLRVASVQDGPAVRDEGAKEVIPTDDPLRVTAFDTSRFRSGSSEEGQAREDDQLRNGEAIVDASRPTSACPLCGGSIIHWRFGSVCRSCHHRFGAADAAEAKGAEIAQTGDAREWGS